MYFILKFLTIHIIVIVIIVIIIVVVIVVVVVIIIIIVDVDHINNCCGHGLQKYQERKDGKWIAAMVTISSISLDSI